jgi:hypothetical protein
VVRALALVLLVAGGCSVERSAHRRYCDTDRPCPTGMCVNHLCVGADTIDSAVDDAGEDDAGGEDAGFDAEPVDASSCSMTCEPPTLCCNGRCANVMEEEDNCGRCDNPCDTPIEGCCDGACLPLNTDMNCAQCGFACSELEDCEGGQCCTTIGTCRDPS